MSGYGEFKKNYALARVSKEIQDTATTSAKSRVDMYPLAAVRGADGVSFNATRSGVHAVTITNAAFFATVLDEACLSIGAYMEGVGAIPIEVRPDSTKAGNSAVVYVKVPQAGTVLLQVSSSLRPDAANTISPYVQPIKNANLGLSASHSSAGGNNPLTSYVHPSMVFISGGWNSHQYWMVATPWAGTGWPDGDIYEDGMLFYSDDLATWTPVNVNASGFANLTAIRLTAGTYIGGSSTDSRLMFDPLGNGGAGTLYHYFRITLSGIEYWQRMQSNNGTTWTNAAGTTGAYDLVSFNGGATLLQSNAGAATGCLAASFLTRNGEVKMWATMQEANLNIHLRYFVSIDGGLTFTDGNQLPDPWTSDFQGAWHTDIQYDDDSRQYVMLGQLQRKASLGSTYASVNMLYTSKDGRNWTQWPVPAAYAGLDTTVGSADTFHIYKGCLCRTGTRQWVIVNAVGKRVDSTKYCSLAGPMTLEFDRPRVTRAVCAVFEEPQGRFFNAVANVASGAILQREPAWFNIGNSGSSVNITSNQLNVIRGSNQAAIACSGTRLNNSYRLFLRATATHTTSILRVGAETGQNLGLHIEGNNSLVRCAQTADAGVAYTNDTSAHIWELRRDELPPTDPNALSVTGSSNNTRTVTVTSTTGFNTFTAVNIYDTNSGNLIMATTIDSVVNGTSFTVPPSAGNVPTNASITVKVTRWRLSALRDNVLLQTFLTSEVQWGQMRVFGSGSADGQGWKIDWIYRLPNDVPMLTIT